MTVIKSASQESALKLLWEKGGPKPDRPGTAFPTVDPKGRIWAANIWTSEFWVFKPDGTFIEAWGDQGSADGQFDFSYQGGEDSIGGLRFAKDGSFYTFDAGNLRVQRFDASRKFVRSWGGFGSGDGQFSKPSAIGLDSQGRVYIADGERADVQVFDPDGTYLRTIAKGQAGVPDHFVYMAVDPAGDVYVSKGQTILKYASDGMPLAVYDFSAFAGDPTPSAVDARGNLFVMTLNHDNSTPGSLIKLDPKGVVLHVWPGVGELLALDRAGTTGYATQFGVEHVRAYALPGS
ncbi:MAG: NHL repeat-containing protein [Chloroflexota bacterium]